MDWTGGRKVGFEGGGRYGSHVVGMEMERGEEGGRRDREREKDTRERIIYHSRLPNNRKEKSTTYIHIPTSYKSVQRYKYTGDVHLPSSYLLDITPTLAFVIHITTRSHYTYLHLVSSIIIIPYNNTDKPVRYLISPFQVPQA